MLIYVKINYCCGAVLYTFKKLKKMVKSLDT